LFDAVRLTLLTVAQRTIFEDLGRDLVSQVLLLLALPQPTALLAPQLAIHFLMRAGGDTDET
jgi:hypothetical protein